MLNKHTGKQLKLLIFVKSVDGGTGSFIMSLKKLEKIMVGLKLKIIVLEEPKFRKIKNLLGFRRSNFYPQKYSFICLNFYYFIQDFFWYKKQKQKFKPDTVLSVDIHCNLITSIEKFFFSRETKTILTTHINLVDTLREKSSQFLVFFLKELVKFFYKKSDANITVSKGIKKQLESSFGIENKVQVINYGIAPNSITKLKNKSNKKIILTMGRLVEQKDYFTLIKAFAKVKAKFSNVQLNIVGDGPMNKRIRDFISRFNLRKEVKLLGWKQNVDEVIQKADIFVLSSKREGFPYVLLEAMSFGLPIISADAPFGPDEILEGGKYGLLYSVGNVDKLASKVLLLINSKETVQHYSRQSIKRAKYYSEEKMLRKYKQIIWSLHNNKPLRPQNRN